jgi:CPA1 family monovalent cation:H+ antiporter
MKPDQMLTVVAVFMSITTLMTYLNYKFFKLPHAIGVMFGSLMMSVVILTASKLGYPFLEEAAIDMISKINFHELLMVWILPALLFAGCLTVNVSDLKTHKWAIAGLATLGVLIATVVIGFCTYQVLTALNFKVNILYCFLFGALISPTDPIAVMGILRKAGAPKNLRVTIVGESLFNDGTAIVAFTILFALIVSGGEPTLSSVSMLFLQEAVGGIAYGLALGMLTVGLLKTIHEAHIAVMVTLMMVVGGATLASFIHVSSPLAIVVAGLCLGYKPFKHMNDDTHRVVDSFWHVIDEFLNGVLFALIGLELLVVQFGVLHVVIAITLFVVLVLSRLLTVIPPLAVMKGIRKETGFGKGSAALLAWGGLRGGVSIALVLALPPSPEKDILLPLTYVIVLGSILIQGLTVGKLVNLLFDKDEDPNNAHVEAEKHDHENPENVEKKKIHAVITN